MNKDELRAAIQYLDACIIDIDRKFEGRSLDADNDAAYKAGVEARDSYAAELAAIEAREAEVERLAANPVHIERTAPAVIVRNDPFDLSELRYDAPAGEVRSKALTAIEKADGITDADRESVEKIVRTVGNGREMAERVILTGSPAYRSGFLKVSGGRPELVDDTERQALSRAASLTGNAGGYAVPYVLDLTMIDTGSHTTNPFRQIARVVPSAANVWHGVSSAGVTASWDSEGAEVSDDAPTLAAPAITCYKGQAFVPFSVEIEGDWANIEADLRKMLMQAKDDLEGAAFATGSTPIGITTALDGTSSELAPATAETFAIADVYAVESALPARYRRNAKWVANKTWYNKVRQFDTAGGAGLWERIGAAQPAQLLGYDAFESSDMDSVLPDAAATADNFGMILGDWSNYVIVDRVGMSIELVPHLLHTSNNLPNGKRGFLAWWRVGADSVNDGAFRMLSIPTAA